MLTPAGKLITLVGFDPSGKVVPLQVTVDGFLRTTIETSGVSAGAMIIPSGKLVTPVGFDPSGNVLPIQLTVDGYLRAVVEGQAFIDFTPVFTSQGGAGGTCSITYAKYLKLTPSLVYITARYVVTAVGTANGSLDFSIPFTISTGSVGVGSEVAATGTLLQAIGITGLLRIVTYTYNTLTPWHLNWDMEVNITVPI